MDTNDQIAAYKTWVAATPKIMRVMYGSNPQVSKLTLTPEALYAEVQAGFASGTTLVSVNQITNTETLDGFQAWYNQVYLPSQV